jgi:peroxiredoxin (alkyl hydroperoxide reductase subunit C)
VAKSRMDGDEGEMTCHDWFFCTKKLDETEVWKAIKKN